MGCLVGSHGLDGACCAAPEEESGGDEVGEVEAVDRKADYVVEDCRGADVEEGQQDRGYGYCDDGDDGNHGSGLNLY